MFGQKQGLSESKGENNVTLAETIIEGFGWPIGNRGMHRHHACPNQRGYVRIKGGGHDEGGSRNTL